MQSVRKVNVRFSYEGVLSLRARAQDSETPPRCVDRGAGTPVYRSGNSFFGEGGNRFRALLQSTTYTIATEKAADQERLWSPATHTLVHYGYLMGDSALQTFLRRVHLPAGGGVNTAAPSPSA